MPTPCRVINMGESTLPVVLSVAVPMLFAALLGYFMFYGRISDAYIGVITLTVSVILFELINSTSGSAYTIGSAELGGFNGIPACRRSTCRATLAARSTRSRRGMPPWGR